jgi:dephospho-CoA kinase
MVIGLTGNIGTGKSTAADMFQKLGAVIIDADRISHRCLDENRDLVRNKLSEIGVNIKKCSDIKRDKLSKLVFNNEKALDVLCRILHPCIIGDIQNRLNKIKNHSSSTVVVIDCPLLFEMSLDKIVDYVVVIATSLEVRLSRLIDKGFSEGQIIKINRYQLPLKDKVKRADFAINNDGSLSYTEEQVKAVWQEINKHLKRRSIL